MSLSRRHFIQLSALGLVAGPTLVSASQQSETGLKGEPGVRRLKLALKPEKRHWFAPLGEPVGLWAFDRDQLRLRQGEPVEIEVENQLPEPSSVHWHGLRIDNAMDGVSGLTQAPIAPGGRFVYRFTPRDAGTYWAHSHHKTYEQLARGLYLPLIVEEPEPVAVNRDLVLTLDDWRLNDARQFDAASLGAMHDWAHGGRTGNLLTVNRQLKPRFNVKGGERVRLRLLNTANARIMALRLPDLPSWIWAKDGQPLATPKAHSGPLLLAPAERYDLVIDLPAQEQGSLAVQLETDGAPIDLAYLQLDGHIEQGPRDDPRPLPANPLAQLGDGPADHSVQLDMTGGAMGRLRQAVYGDQTLSVRELVQQKQIWAFNGVVNMPEMPLLEVRSGDLVEVEMLNNTRWPHSMHLHGQHFQSDLTRYHPGLWHDTVVMAPGEQTRIRFRAGNPGSWLLHCHMIEHQAAGMVSWIRVLA
ncbi:multicopper oxidase family protein [Marinobacterium mangrovicola]|uniref:FtsP/CotA-like multicopper oxidase with cupredoxin domain n=1 Tax=Marinobacterium mangrovicola TaxID=1476959 RepID=A0A4R1G743_9GAMM|nr:multicopper oxidase family protein [Marinobacterium mangrovicola]TCK02350.1 FtsP/CotA-like multicopper oxidase with cupredoxin domain [Marinobacterium mangrovicola]